MKLSLLSILLGAGLGAPQIYGLAQPKKFAAGVRKFPRNYAAGVVLMLLATAWFLWIVNDEPIADFSAYKPMMLAGFAAVGSGLLAHTPIHPWPRGHWSGCCSWISGENC